MPLIGGNAIPCKEPWCSRKPLMRLERKLLQQPAAGLTNKMPLTGRPAQAMRPRWVDRWARLLQWPSLVAKRWLSGLG